MTTADAGRTAHPARPVGSVDWDALMRLGLGALRMSPDEFWSMTPREFRCALEGAGLASPAGAAPGRDDLEALMRRFPDQPPAHAGRGG